ncbi:hypothetical protein BASA81_000538 [Batrachochytrium salamandrivorans]|nr:hypothetical protein BASA81_000538 [Batrachochytrium salamandrivorans]
MQLVVVLYWILLCLHFAMAQTEAPVEESTEAPTFEAVEYEYEVDTNSTEAPTALGDTLAPTTDLEESPAPTTDSEETPGPTIEYEETSEPTIEYEGTLEPTIENEGTLEPTIETEETPAPTEPEDTTSSPTITVGANGCVPTSELSAAALFVLTAMMAAH